ncbi:hypothetical protein RHMOL_Rhmol13G0165000 [Rhododendron molle]|uniref:Uncharacterized protein n=1 Tax=Rhododendron molle TaxID=49168 RepID=A0ACC0L8J2_RHOML|nr:hypothetical protein RHMOL_Rhmol13G0165000 [Rhododendron molle]
MDYFLLVLATLLFLGVFLLRKYTWRTNLPPGPPVLPCIGNLHQLEYSSPLYHQLWKLSQKYGPLMSLRLGFTPVLVVSSSKMAKQVLKTHDAEFASRPPFLSFKKLSYNGLGVAFAPYNDSWREMRKICILHLFSPKRVQSFRPIRENEVSKLIKKIGRNASDSKFVNLSEMLILFSNTIITRIAFGSSYDEESSERSMFENLLSDSQAVSANFFFSDYFPCLSWVDRLTGGLTRLEKTFKALDSFYQGMVDEHKSDEKRGNSKKLGQEDFIDVLLQLQKDGSSPIKLTFDHIKAVLQDIFTAGTDTSAATLVWAMTELVKNPNTMEKAQQEIRNIAGNNGSTIHENDLQESCYLQAVIKETMRLHPPAPLLVPHETTQKCNIFEYEIPPKTVVHVNAWAIGRDPDSWENPDKFLPERFIGNSIDFRGRDFELIPFGAGRRGCPGLHMGVATVEFALANLLYWFNWELPDGMKQEDIDTDVKPGITMHKKNPLCLMPRKWSGNLDE